MPIGSRAIFAGTVAAFCLASGTASAADAKGSFAVHGMGGQTCKTMIDRILQGDAAMRPVVTSWLLGYLSAVNRRQPDTFDDTPVVAPDALMNMLVSVCRQHEDVTIEAAVNSILQTLSVAKVTHDSPLVEARSGDQVVTLRADTLMAIQQALTRGKYLTAPADGTFGPTTAAALRAFQKAESLPETGLPDPATTIRLLIELPTKNK